jgi:hypothetical protein
MAGLECFVNSGTQTLVADTVETVLQIKAASNHRVKIKGYSITMGGIVVKDLIIKVLTQTDAGTPGTTLTPVKWSVGAAETIQTAAYTNFSAEPAASTVFQYKRLQSSYEKIFPLGQELIVAGGGYLGIAVTSVGDSCDLAAEIIFEE